MPVVLYQSDADIEDPIANTYFTLQQFQSRGAPDVQMEVVSGLSHQQAALPYALYAKTYFENLRSDCLSLASDDNIRNPAVNVYPNPASAFINVRYDGLGAGSMIRIYNFGLKPVFQSSLDGNPLDIQFLSPGIYLLELTNGSGRSAFRMFAKQNF